MKDQHVNLSQSTRLSRISTLWTQFRDAHQGTDHEEAAGVAANHAQVRQDLLLRYQGAVRRYLLGAVRDVESADELLHEFTIRFLQGDFHRADPQRGRFRDYLRTVLINLVNDHFREKKKSPLQVLDDIPDKQWEASENTRFDECFRDELMERTWQALRKANESYERVLRIRVTEQDATSSELSARLAEAGIDMTPSSVRKTVERSRKKFAKLFFEEVLDLVEFDTPEELHTELKRLNLLIYCEHELAERGL